MHLRQVGVDRLRELEERLRFLEGQEFRNLLKDPQFPHLLSLTPGTIDEHHIPTWYTKIQDTIEHFLVIYDDEDIEQQRFLEIKIDFQKDTVTFYFFLRDERNSFIQKKSIIQLDLLADIKDFQNGTIRFDTVKITDIRLNETSLRKVS